MTQEIAEVGSVDPAEATAILNEYHNLAVTQEYIAQGGTEYAERLLIKTLGPDGARAMLEAVAAPRRSAPASSTRCRKPIPSNSPSFCRANTRRPSP